MKIQLGDMAEIESADVQIQIRAAGQVVWINVNGSCVLRACQIGNLEIADDRRDKVRS